MTKISKSFCESEHLARLDLVFELDGKLQPVEIKSSSTVTPYYIRAGQKAARLSPQGGLAALVDPWRRRRDFERSGIRTIGRQKLQGILLDTLRDHAHE